MTWVISLALLFAGLLIQFSHGEIKINHSRKTHMSHWICFGFVYAGRPKFHDDERDYYRNRSNTTAIIFCKTEICFVNLLLSHCNWWLQIVDSAGATRAPEARWVWENKTNHQIRLIEVPAICGGKVGEARGPALFVSIEFLAIFPCCWEHFQKFWHRKYPQPKSPCFVFHINYSKGVYELDWCRWVQSPEC